MDRRYPSGPRRAAIALASATLLVSACGGDEAVSFKRAGPPAPKKCVDQWNADDKTLGFGRHAHSPGHDSRAGRVFFVNEPRRDLPNTCVVVFAASESDREYGTLGQFSTETRNIGTGLLQRSWQYITYFPGQSQEQRLELQRSGAERANVSLDESGKIEPLD